MSQTLITDTVPRCSVEGQRLDALELILGGLVDPIDGFCLPGETPANWPAESVFAVSTELARAAGRAGALLLTDPDGTPLARLALSAHRAGEVGLNHLSGALTAMRTAEHPPARDIRVSSDDDFTKSTVVLFTAPPEPAEIAQALCTAAGHPLVFVAVTWKRSHHDYAISRTIKELQRCAAEIPEAGVRYLPLAPLNPSMQFVDVLDLVLTRIRPCTLLNLSKPPHVDSEVDPAPVVHSGCVVLFTGLSGSGKSTVARALSERMSELGRRSVLLDGDDVRRVLSSGLGFSAVDREENLRRIGWVAARLAEVGGIALCAPIAPFDRMRREIRSMAEDSGSFLLVHVATPLDVCEQRDRKGLYAQARAGQIKDFTGISSPYEVPSDADLTVDTSNDSVEEIVNRILALL